MPFRLAAALYVVAIDSSFCVLVQQSGTARIFYTRQGYHVFARSTARSHCPFGKLSTGIITEASLPPEKWFYCPWRLTGSWNNVCVEIYRQQRKHDCVWAYIGDSIGIRNQPHINESIVDYSSLLMKLSLSIRMLSSQVLTGLGRVAASQLAAKYKKTAWKMFSSSYLFFSFVHKFIGNRDRSHNEVTHRWKGLFESA